jgi:hypothetical protein
VDLIFLLGILVAILLAVCAVFVLKWAIERRRVVALEDANATSLQLNEYSNRRFLELALLSYNETVQAWNAFHDEVGSSLTALRINFEAETGFIDSGDQDIKTKTLIDYAYNKVRQLDFGVQYDSCFFFNAIGQMTLRASALTGLSVAVKNFGFFGRLDAHTGYLLYYSIQTLLGYSINLDKVRAVDISISNKGDMALLVFQVKSANPKELASVLKNTNGIQVEAVCDDNPVGKSCKVIVIVPYI